MAIREGDAAKREGAELRRVGAIGKPVRPAAIPEGHRVESRGSSGIHPSGSVDAEGETKYVQKREGRWRRDPSPFVSHRSRTGGIAMLDQLLPRSADNNYCGNKLALWLFGLVVLV